MSYILFSGGLIIWPIILLSIISLAIIIEKSWNLARDMILPRDLTKDVISQIEKKSLTSEMKEKMAYDSIQGTIFFGLLEEKIKSKTNLDQGINQPQFGYQICSVLGLYLNELLIARLIFGSCCLSMIISIIFFIREIHLSTNALKLHMSDMDVNVD